MLIKNHFTGAVICEIDSFTELVRYKHDLRDADLRDADLCNADLRYADLRYADLREADLRYADLRYADLCNANLSDADLRYVDLSYADLREADLSGTKIQWQSHDLVAEILRHAADGDVEKLKIAGYILVCREKCWHNFLRINDPLTGWALTELAKYYQGLDGEPEVLKQYVNLSTTLAW